MNLLPYLVVIAVLGTKTPWCDALGRRKGRDIDGLSQHRMLKSLFDQINYLLDAPDEISEPEETATSAYPGPEPTRPNAFDRSPAGGQSSSAAFIINNEQWYDDFGVEIRANDGGQITKFGDTYYWVGNDLDIETNGNDIHMYSSETLGSGDWKWEGKMVDFEPDKYNGNANLIRCPRTGNYLIITKGLNFYESDSVNGPYTLANNVWPSQVPPKIDPSNPDYVWGGLSVYQENDDAYIVVSRFDKNGSAKDTRSMGIYKLTADCKDVEEEIYWRREGAERAEAPYIFKKGDLYYMTMSETRGWKPTKTNYWTAEDIAGPWTVHGEVGMDPSSSGSHNSQHRYIMMVDDNQWIFGGDRYPYYEPDIFPEEEGQNIILPVTWNGDKLIVNFEEVWEINAVDQPPPSENESSASALIINDTQWYDNNDVEIRANDGGHITELEGTYYWVGNDIVDKETNGNDIHMYSSETLRSGDWKWEGKMVDFEPDEYNGSANLIRCPGTGEYLIITKGLNFYESSFVSGPFTLVNNVWPSQVPPTIDPSNPDYAWGGLSVFQENDDAYIVVSRFDKNGAASDTRSVGIYKLTSDCRDVEEEIYWRREGAERAETPYIFRRGDLYYMTMSETRGWKPTKTNYWTAEDIAGPWTVHGEVGMDPSSTTSHNSRHSYIMLAGDRWIFGGDRYSYYEPDMHPKEEGQNIILPVTWDGDKPIVNFEEVWEINVNH